MPQLYETNGIRIFVYSNEGSLESLPRVYVSLGSGEAEFLISHDNPPIVMLKRSYGLDGESLKLSHEHIKDRAKDIRDAWINLFC